VRLPVGQPLPVVPTGWLPTPFGTGMTGLFITVAAITLKTTQPARVARFWRDLPWVTRPPRTTARPKRNQTSKLASRTPREMRRHLDQRAPEPEAVTPVSGSSGLGWSGGDV
jgi:hypothetical protein